jgi:hypothetical protein
MLSNLVATQNRMTFKLSKSDPSEPSSVASLDFTAARFRLQDRQDQLLPNMASGDKIPTNFIASNLK